MGTEKSGQLRRVLGVGFGLAVSVGATIGVGILRTPGLVAGQVHTPSTIILLWTAAGLYTLLGASCLSELGTMLPQDGGYYVYVRHAFGNTAGFAVGWTDWLTYCSVLAYVSIAIAEFLGIFMPSVSSAVRLVAICILTGVVVLQSMGIRISSRFQEITTSFKCIAFVALIVACLLLPAGRYPAERGTASSMTVSGVVIALQATLITYGGWQSPLYFTEEDRDPSRNLPRTMIGGVLAVIVIYVLVNIGLLNVLSVSGLAGTTLPAADAAYVIAGPRGRDLISLLSVVSLVPVLNAVMMIGTRIIFAMGRDRLFWAPTSAVNAGGTPHTAMVLTTTIAVALIATGTFQRLIAMTSVFLAANYLLCCLALITLRYREPETQRPYRAWAYPWSAWIVAGGAVVFLVGILVGDTFNGLAALGLCAVGLVGRKVLTPRMISASG
jgi:APA family basic amino acid/polyamine antiporter